MKTSIILSICFLCFKVQSQNFEGIIKYEVSFKNPTPAFMSEEEFKKKNPNLKSHYEFFYFKDNTYKYVYGNNIDALDPLKQRVYTYVIGADTSLWNDANMASEDIIEVKKNTEKDTVLGFICESITFRTKWGKTIFTFNRDQLKIDASKFSNHAYKSLGDFLKESNCLPLKITYRTGFECLVYTAVNIQEKKLDLKEFNIPAFRYPIKNHHQ